MSIGHSVKVEVGAAEFTRMYSRVHHQFHAIVPLLGAFKQDLW
jgi:hypothetical protein